MVKKKKKKVAKKKAKKMNREEPNIYAKFHLICSQLNQMLENADAKLLAIYGRRVILELYCDTLNVMETTENAIKFHSRKKKTK